MSIESKERYSDIKDYPIIKNKIIYSPNGVDVYQIEKLGVNRIEYNEKENIILTVGRIGWSPKSHQTLLDSIPKIKNLKNWKIYLVGFIEKSFKKEIKNLYENYPYLKEKVIFTGFVSRKKLFEYYQKSKIFCLTSINESFGIVLVEAGYFGNYIVSTNIPTARDITKNGELGKLFKVRDSEELAKILENLIENEKIIEVSQNDSGVINFNENQEILDFIEKPITYSYVSMGIYVLNKKVIEPLSKNEPYGFDQLIIKGVKNKLKLKAYLHKSYWLDIGCNSDYQKANEYYANNRAKFLNL